MTAMTASAPGAADGKPAEKAALDIRDHAEVAGYETIGSPFVDDPKMSARNVNVFYGDKQAILDVSLDQVALERLPVNEYVDLFVI